MKLARIFSNYIAVHSEPVEAAISRCQPFDCDLPEHRTRRREQTFMLMHMQGIEVPDV